jgi:medium-chain acyl-[acyl-carrier-protein] hydrolase
MGQLTQGRAPDLAATVSTAAGAPQPGTASAARWLVRWRPVEAPQMRLFCLPHAGGGAAAYRAWAHCLAPQVEVVAIRLPGRESRMAEPPLRRVADVVGGLLGEVVPLLDRPHAWFGHSLGALTAFETCRALFRARLPAPARLIVSGRMAPHLPPLESPVHNAPLHDFLARLRELNGTPPEILADPVMLTGLLPMLRADFAAVETYACEPAPPLACPVSVFGGTDDRFVSAAGIDAWRQHTTAECTVRMLGGDHFFLHRSPGEFAFLVAGDLAGA